MRLGLVPDVTAELFGEACRDGESEPAALAVCPSDLSLRERLEEVRYELGWDTVAGIADSDLDMAGGGAGAVARMGELAAEGRLTDEVPAFAGSVFDDEEIAVAEVAGYFEAAADYVPKLLSFLRQLREYQGPTHEDPAVLGAMRPDAGVEREDSDVVTRRRT